MTRTRYARYVLERIAGAAAVALGAGLLAHACQRLGLLAPLLGRHASRAVSSSGPARLLWWAWPAAAAAAAHVVLGPKQRRPIYLRVPGAMYVYAGVKVDRNAGCRGGCVTGATGSGKTLACIIPRLHSLCVNEPGVERPGWRVSPEGRELERLRRASRSASARASSDADLALRALHAHAGAVHAQRYRSAPWGGFVCGEKGNEWHTTERILRLHSREEDLCILRTRPAQAPAHWAPPARFNLLSMDAIPADTYAKMIVDTSLCLEESGTRDEFFVPQARDKIAWGLRLSRAVYACRRGTRASAGRDERPSLLTLLEILTVHESYRRFLGGCMAELPSLAESEAFAEARFQLENNYWNQPPDQLGGVRSTVHNFLAPYCEPEIAEVFCSDSTFELGMIQQGKVVSLAIPQKFALQRRYVATLMKTLVYQIVLERFDRGSDHPDWINRNVILVEQDEWQRHAVGADCEVDVVREACGAVYAATQSQNAVWRKLGGRDHAAPLIANLRNRWICQAATEECAEESSAIVSGKISREVSYSRGDTGSTTSVSFAEKPLLPRRVLRTLRPFEVVFAPAQGRWLYRRCIAMPATPDGTIPGWWFGDWNPLHWVAAALGLPERIAGIPVGPGAPFIPPWRAAAPLRAQLRWLLGLDGTFIVLEQRRARSRRP